MQKLKVSSAAAFFILTFIVFWIVRLQFGHELTVEIASGLIIGVTAAVILTWLPASLQAIKEGVLEGAAFLSLGVMLLTAALFSHRVYATVFRWLGHPEWLVESFIESLVQWFMFCACCIILLAPGTTGGDVPGRNWFYVMLSVSLGSLIAGITIGIFIV